MTDYQVKVFNKYKSFINTQPDYCKPQQQILLHQSILADRIKHYNNLLIYHQTGSGKTCAAIQIATQAQLTDHYVHFIMPRALIQNFNNELNSFCAKNLHTSHIHTYHGFIKFLSNKKNRHFFYNNKNLIIIDEVHNILNSRGSTYNAFIDLLKLSPNSKIVLMTATPIVDDIEQLIPLFNLLLVNQYYKSSNTILPFTRPSFKFNFCHNDSLDFNKFSKFFGKYISYYPGPPSSAIPKLTFKYQKVTLHPKQISAIKAHKTYTSLTNNIKQTQLVTSTPPIFYLQLRQISNVFFYKNTIISPKFDSIYKNMDFKHKIFVYSSFTNNHGIASFCKYLELKQNWKYYFDCTPQQLLDESIFKYVKWLGDTPTKLKFKILKLFNSSNNLYGNKIKLFIGSPAAKEGLSFEAVTQVHILEPYWNWSRIYQIYSRAVRFCKHQSLKPNERQVHVFLYIASAPSMHSIDQYIINILNKKKDLIDRSLSILQNSSFDFLLHSKNLLPYGPGKQVALH